MLPPNVVEQNDSLALLTNYTTNSTSTHWSGHCEKDSIELLIALIVPPIYACVVLVGVVGNAMVVMVILTPSCHAQLDQCAHSRYGPSLGV